MAFNKHSVSILSLVASDTCINLVVPCMRQIKHNINIPVIFQVASLLAALFHPGNIVLYAPGDSLPCRRDPS